MHDTDADDRSALLPVVTLEEWQQARDALLDEYPSDDHSVDLGHRRGQAELDGAGPRSRGGFRMTARTVVFDVNLQAVEGCE
jgi:hypothetical protein